MDTSENTPFRSLGLSLPNHESRPILATDAWRRQPIPGFPVTFFNLGVLSLVMRALSERRR